MKPVVGRLAIDKGDHSGVIYERLLVEGAVTDEAVHLRWLVFEIKAGPIVDLGAWTRGKIALFLSACLKSRLQGSWWAQWRTETSGCQRPTPIKLIYWMPLIAIEAFPFTLLLLDVRRRTEIHKMLGTTAHFVSTPLCMLLSGRLWRS